MKRDVSIDIAKAITIILMVVGHCDALIPIWLFKGIFSFHLPLFFFFSGYFFSNKRTCLEECKHSAKTFLVPYLLTGAVIVILQWLLYSPNAALHSLQGLFMASGGRRGMPTIFPYHAGPIWFLFALFWTRVLFRIIYKVIPKHCIVASMIIGVAFMVFGKEVINLPLAFGNGASALFFYAGGYGIQLLMSKYENVVIKWRIPIFLLCLLIWMIDIRYSYLNIDQYIYHKFPLPLFGAFAGVWIVWRISAIIKGVISTWLQFVGKHTLDILCCHTIAFCLCAWTIRAIDVNMHPQLMVALLTVVLSVIIVTIKELLSCIKC